LFSLFLFILGVLDALKPVRCSSATFVPDIFLAVDGNSLNVNENLTHKKRCITILLHRYLSGESIPSTIGIKTMIQSARANTAVDQ
jgi:hypothetical protein